MSDEVEVYKNNDPTIYVKVERRDPWTGVVSNVDLSTVGEIEFTVVRSATDSVTYTKTAGGVVVTNAAAGECEVRATADATDKPGTYTFSLDLITAGRRTTVRSGQWRVRDRD